MLTIADHHKGCGGAQGYFLHLDITVFAQCPVPSGDSHESSKEYGYDCSSEEQHIKRTMKFLSMLLS